MINKNNASEERRKEGRKEANIRLMKKTGNKDHVTGVKKKKDRT